MTFNQFLTLKPGDRVRIIDVSEFYTLDDCLGAIVVVKHHPMKYHSYNNSVTWRVITTDPLRRHMIDIVGGRCAFKAHEIERVHDDV
jgi:hypothetical protein